MLLPLVTVVIPSYNHRSYIKECIQSVVSQSYKNLEIIIIDDASTDGSATVIREFEFYENITCIFNETNLGLTKNLNIALDFAKGKYFCMLSSDDIWCANKLKEIIPYMELREDVGVCGASHVVINEQGDCLLSQKIYPYSELTFLDVFLRNKNRRGPSAATTTFRTEVLRKIGKYDEAINLEDMDVWLRVTAAGYKIVTLNNFLAYYRVHSSNAHKDIEFMYSSMSTIWEKFAGHDFYEEAIGTINVDFFSKASKRNKKLAVENIKKNTYSGV